ncbi:hypothetical protein BHE90_017134 [Fusarium euwallaceae]|uniref:Uncharacterized protein n=1 Tax=Fusarium euwallaceae TaxID=1147111 RepID=A0A430KYC0_9HYPO|nr:hypothetical protein BHE90_017134 [Fusarium euwallaceae]
MPSGKRVILWDNTKATSPPSFKRCLLFILLLFITRSPICTNTLSSSPVLSLVYFFQAHALPSSLALIRSSLRLWNVHVAPGLAPSPRAVAHQFIIALCTASHLVLMTLCRQQLSRLDNFPCIGSRARLSLRAYTVIYHIKLFVMSSYNYEDDDVYYGPGCCMKCCRALDVGNHDACGACYCRRSFKPDYDRDIQTGWSLGQYYPGRRLEDWTDVSNSAAPVVNSNNQGEHGTSSRSTSGSTSHTTHDTITASKARQPSEQTGGSEDSKKSKEGKKAKPKSFFATLLSWIWG